LVLAASNAPCASISEVVAFASECLDREDRAANMETNAPSSASSGRSLPSGDAEGIDYETVLLATAVCDVFCIAGVALLAKAGQLRAASLTLLADSVAVCSSSSATRSAAACREARVATTANI
jgi:predicted small integral membrane protein